MAIDLATSIDDDRLRPFLPLVYVAWSDGELAPDEITGICELVAGYPGIDEDCQVALQRWLDPDDPPSPQELEALRLQIVKWAETLGVESGRSVVDLGVAIAESTRPDANVTGDEMSALADVEAEYGPLGPVPAVLGGPMPLRDLVEPTAPFELQQLTSILDGRHAQIRDRMRAVLTRPEFAYPDQLDRDAYRELVLVWTQILADEGLGVLSYPDPHGPDDPGSFVAAFTMLGHHDLSLMTKFGVQFGLFGGSIALLGSVRHHDEYLPAVGSLSLPGCFAMTETGHGSNVRDLETVAVYDGETDEFVVNTPNDMARKDYIGNAAAHGQLAVVFARLVVGEADNGVHAVLVPIRDADGTVLPGITIEDNAGKGGLNGVDNGRIWFGQVRVPRTALLDRFASVDEQGVYHSDIPNPDRRFFTMIGTLVGGRVSVGAASVNVAKSALTTAIRYAHRRRQFGPATGAETLLIDYPVHQQELIPRLAATYAYHFAFENLIDDYADQEGDQRKLEADAAGWKAHATWHALDTIQAAREACGAQGYLAVNRLTSMRADADIFTTYEGDNTVLTQLVAKALLTEFGQQFESMNATAMVRYLFHRAASALAEASPVTLSTTDTDQLVDAGWQISQLQWREAHIVESLAQRVKKRIEAGTEPTEAFIQVQAHAAIASASHVERATLEAFASAVDQIDDEPVRRSLDNLRALHGLSVIRANLGWFQEHSRFSGATSRQVRKVHKQLVQGVARDSLALVDAFSIPEKVLAAPIAAYQ